MLELCASVRVCATVRGEREKSNRAKICFAFSKLLLVIVINLSHAIFTKFDTVAHRSLIFICKDVLHSIDLASFLSRQSVIIEIYRNRTVEREGEISGIAKMISANSINKRFLLVAILPYFFAR